MKGLVHIYTGNGKGKTTAAIGLGIRAYGRGFKVLMVQFLKGAETGELAVINELGPRFKLRRGKEVKKFTWSMNEEELKALKKSMEEIYINAVSEAKSGNWDMLILDEILGSISSKLISAEDVAEFIKNKPESLELILTGRNAPQELIDLSDYVSEINPIKHPFNKGIPARKGIES